MSEDTNTYGMICTPTFLMPKPTVPCDLGLCESCGKDIWVSRSAKQDAIDDGRKVLMICFLCFLAYRVITDEDPDILPPGPHVREDLAMLQAQRNEEENVNGRMN